MKASYRRLQVISIFTSVLFVVMLLFFLTFVNQNNKYKETIEMYEVFHDYNDEPYKLQIQKGDVVCMHFSNNLEQLATSCDAYHEYKTRQEELDEE